MIQGPREQADHQTYKATARGEKRTKFSCGKRPRPGCAEWIHVFFMLYDGTEGLLADFCRSKYMNPLRTS